MIFGKNGNWLRFPILGLFAIGLGLAGISCASTAAPTSAPSSAAPAATSAPASAASSGQKLTLTGAGSTFDNPLFTKAFAEYTKLHPNVQVNYQSIGSGGGVQQLTNGTVDFGASDFPLSADQTKAIGQPVIHVAVALGAASVAYNLPGVQAGLKLDGPTLANIYLGTITKWNDSAIAKLNPDLKLPATDIAVVHRSDGSGTTDIFTTYLNSVSPAWKSKVGSGASVNWPVGIGAKGSEGVAGQVEQVPGGIGYFEMAYAVQNKLTQAAIANGAGQFVLPSTDGASACAAKASVPPDLKVRISGCTGTGVYSISGFSWAILRQNQKDAARGKAMVDLFRWETTDGQQFASALGYAPLPSQVATLDGQALDKITFGQ